MATRYRPVYLLGLLLYLWPGLLLADAPVQPPPPSFPPSFFLVASPRLSHTWFSESVVLVTRIGERGPIGIMVNRPRELLLDQIFPGYPSAKGMRLFMGGPVNVNQVSYLFRGDGANTKSVKVSEHLFFATSKSLLGDLLGGAREFSGLRVVNGLAVWAPGQLENEIARGDWFVLPTDEVMIFDHPIEKMWLELLHRAVIAPRRTPEAMRIPAETQHGAVG